MRLSVLQCDWKDELSEGEIDQAMCDVGGLRWTSWIQQHDVDAKVLAVCSEAISPVGLAELWETGDLMLADKSVWEGKHLAHILEQIRDHVALQERMEANEDGEV